MPISLLAKLAIIFIAIVIITQNIEFIFHVIFTVAIIFVVWYFVSHIRVSDIIGGAMNTTKVVFISKPSQAFQNLLFNINRNDTTRYNKMIKLRKSYTTSMDSTFKQYDSLKNTKKYKEFIKSDDNKTLVSIIGESGVTDAYNKLFGDSTIKKDMQCHTKK